MPSVADLRSGILGCAPEPLAVVDRKLAGQPKICNLDLQSAADFLHHDVLRLDIQVNMVTLVNEIQTAANELGDAACKASRYPLVYDDVMQVLMHPFHFDKHKLPLAALSKALNDVGMLQRLLNSRLLENCLKWTLRSHLHLLLRHTRETGTLKDLAEPPTAVIAWGLGISRCSTARGFRTLSRRAILSRLGVAVCFVRQRMALHSRHRGAATRHPQG
mmetsp:Transcript_1561/g.3237  ORF Transcript_1561/g.3237 Transcript_1561/m.3237 type:complete len:218 (+) Transcript_1561:499-1152(+)